MGLHYKERICFSEETKNSFDKSIQKKCKALI